MSEYGAFPVFYLKEALNSPGLRDLPKSVCDAMLSEAGIDRAVLGREEAEITAEQFGLFWLEHVKITHDEFFSLDGRGLPRGSFGLLCRLVLATASLEQAIGRMLRFLSVLLSDCDARLNRNGHIAEIVFNEKGPPRSSFEYSIFFTIVLGLSHWLIDRRIPLLETDLRSNCGKGEQHYRNSFCPKIRFKQPVTRVTFDANFLTLVPFRDEMQLKEFLSDVPQSLLKIYSRRDSISARVKRELSQNQFKDWPSFDDLANIFYTTSSTLRRRLLAEGTSYQTIKDEERRDRAMQLLFDTRMPISEISEELGFGDPSTFYRAFKKWTGASPKMFVEAAQARRK